MKMEDCRNWNEKEYRASIVAERDVHSRTIFAAAFVPATASAVPEHVAIASSNGSVALYPVQPSVSSSHLLKLDERELQWYNLATLSYSTMFSHVDWRKEICLNGLGDWGYGNDSNSPGIAKPSMIVGKHDGPAYSLLSYGEDHNALLLSCGDYG